MSWEDLLRTSVSSSSPSSQGTSQKKKYIKVEKLRKEAVQPNIIPISSVKGLNEVLGGGIVEGFTYLLEGGAGAGKTTLAQLIALDMIQRGYKVVVLLLEATPTTWMNTNINISQRLYDAKQEGKLDIYLLYDNDIRTIDEILQQYEGQKMLVVMDSVSLLWSKAPSTARTIMAKLVRALKRHNATALLISQVGSGQFDTFGGAGVEHAVDAVVQLNTFFSSRVGELVRLLRVKKQRLLRHSLYQHPYLIVDKEPIFRIISDRTVIFIGNKLELKPIKSPYGSELLQQVEETEQAETEHDSGQPESVSESEEGEEVIEDMGL